MATRVRIEGLGRNGLVPVGKAARPWTVHGAVVPASAAGVPARLSVQASFEHERRADLAASRFIAAAGAVAMLLLLARPLWQGGVPLILAVVLLAQVQLCGLVALLRARRLGRRNLVLRGLWLAAGGMLGAWLAWWLWLAPAWLGAALAVAVQAPLLLHLDIRRADDAGEHLPLLRQ
jgi:hypothetical protein